MYNSVVIERGGGNNNFYNRGLDIVKQDEVFMITIIHSPITTIYIHINDILIS